jgi:hypothetical protein
MPAAWTLWFNSVSSALALNGQSFTVAQLPGASSYPKGTPSFAANGRKAGEGAGAGTGVPIWTDGSKWLTFYDNTEVQA